MWSWFVKLNCQAEQTATPCGNQHTRSYLCHRPTTQLKVERKVGTRSIYPMEHIVKGNGCCGIMVRIVYDEGLLRLMRCQRDGLRWLQMALRQRNRQLSRLTATLMAAANEFLGSSWVHRCCQLFQMQKYRTGGLTRSGRTDSLTLSHANADDRS